MFLIHLMFFICHGLFRVLCIIIFGLFLFIGTTSAITELKTRAPEWKEFAEAKVEEWSDDMQSSIRDTMTHLTPKQHLTPRNIVRPHRVNQKRIHSLQSDEGW